MGEVISMDNWRRSHDCELPVEVNNNAQTWSLKEMLESTIKDIDSGKISDKAHGIVCIDAGDDIVWSNARLNQEEAQELLMDVLAHHIEDEDLEEL